jgi:UDPglucose--hexose-1-phosphate uridylyltransferase
MFSSPHRRFNPLTREWILVSPHRAKRPLQGQIEKSPPVNLPQYDPTCYLCPGNERVGGMKNPAYTGTFAFDNDFAALLPEGADITSYPETDNSLSSVLFCAEPETGFATLSVFRRVTILPCPKLTLRKPKPL